MRSKIADSRKQARFLEEQVRNQGKEKQSLLNAMEMAVSLSNFQSSLNKIESSRTILKTTAARIQEMIQFKIISFYLVNEQDSSFCQAYCDPEESSSSIEKEVKLLIDDKTFSLALRINKPTIVTSADGSEQIMLHPLFTSSRTRGMFIGVLAQDRKNISDISLILFTMAMVANAYALESFGLYHRIKNINKELETNIANLETSEKELTKVNKKLQQDILKRKRAERALKQAEEKYRSIFENAVEGIFQTAPAGYYISANPALARIHGYHSPEELIYKVTNIASQLCVDRGQYENFLRRMDQDGTIYNLEMQMYRKDGSTNWVSINAHAVRDEKKSLLYYEGTLMDITEKKVLEAQLLQAQKIEAIGCLAGGVAHDFNNILMAIIGFTEVALCKIPKGTPAQYYLDQVLQAGSRATALVKQILTFSRQTEPERKPIQVIPIIREVLSLLRSSLPSTIEICQGIITSPENDIILGDPTQIHQVLMNLCTNAAHAMRAAGGILRVNLSDIEADGRFVLQYPGLKLGPYMWLTVNDTGHGMDAAMLERIFDPYFTTKGPSEGTGLGLAVVQAIVKSHGGAIAVNSEKGKGTTFHVFLPKIEEQIIPKAEAIEVLLTGDERILFVDDENALTDLVKEMIEPLGYLVTAETNSIKALEMFRRRPGAFDLVITDITMPGLTGIALAKELMIIRPDIPIILCTGFSELISEKQTREMGIREFVMKPFTTSKLANIVRKVLDEK
jgi:PAS domain S-box-containing protein